MTPALAQASEDRELEDEHRERKRPSKSAVATEAVVLPEGDPASRGARGALGAEGQSALEVSQLMVQSQRRHDLEMRMAVLAVEYDRALAGLQSLVRRYDGLQAECEAARMPSPSQRVVPSLLRTAVKLARQQVRTQYPDLKGMLGGQ